MSGQHKFSELTKGFTPEDRRQIEAIKARMRVASETSEPSNEAEIFATQKDKPAKAN